MRKLTAALSALLLAFTAMLAQADDHAAPTQPVGMVYGLDVSDPPAFAAAMAKYWDSPTGKQSSGIAILRQVVAAGESTISHLVSVAHQSYDGMDASFALNAASADWAAFLSEVDGIATVVTSSVFEGTGLGSMKNNIGAGPGVATLYIFISVSDPGKYAKSWQKMMGDADLGETDTMLFAIPAGGVDDTTHVASISGKSVGTVMAQMNANSADKAFQKFIKDVAGIRTIERKIVTVDLAVFGNTGG